MQSVVKRDKLNFAPMSEALIRSIIFKSLLFEGFKDDQRWLIEKYPQEQLKLSQLQPKWIGWLISRFGENPKFKETHPFEEVIESVTSFSKVFDSVAAKWKSSEIFRKNVEGFLPNRSWKKSDITPQIIPLLTSDEMEVLKGLATRDKQNFEINISEEEMESDRVGKVGPWNLWMPTTKERSCKIAQYNPVSLKPKTTWCTARMAGSNLFYNYIGKPGQEITLFYIIKDNPSLANDWLSVGFVNGKPVLEGRDNYVSVNRDNKGLTSAKLKLALEKDYDQIMLALSDKNKSLGGKHPAREKIRAAALSVEALQYLTSGLSQTEAGEIIIVVLKEPNVSAEVLAVLAQNKDEYVRWQVATNVNTTADTLTSLVRDTHEYVRWQVATNVNTPVTTLIDLIGDKNLYVRIEIANSLKIPEDFLVIMAKDESEKVRGAVAKNPNIPVSTLIDLSKDVNKYVRYAVTQNPKTPEFVLKSLAKDLDLNVRQGVVKNPKTPDSVITDFIADKDANIRRSVALHTGTSTANLTTLAGDITTFVRTAVAENPQTPAAVLTTMATDADDEVRGKVAGNKNTPIKALADLAKDENVKIMYSVAGNNNVTVEILTKMIESEAIRKNNNFSDWLLSQIIRNKKTPPEILEKFVKHPLNEIKQLIISNPNVTIPILQKLSKDRSSTIRLEAKTKLDKLQQVQNESRLRRLIRQML